MVLLETPSSTASQVFQSITDHLGNPGILGMVVLILGLLGVFWVLEIVVDSFQPKKPRMTEEEWEAARGSRLR